MKNQISGSVSSGPSKLTGTGARERHTSHAYGSNPRMTRASSGASQRTSFARNGHSRMAKAGATRSINGQ
jgi:hypothetical protein